MFNPYELAIKFTIAYICMFGLMTGTISLPRTKNVKKENDDLEEMVNKGYFR